MLGAFLQYVTEIIQSKSKLSLARPTFDKYVLTSGNYYIVFKALNRAIAFRCALESLQILMSGYWVFSSLIILSWNVFWLNNPISCQCLEYSTILGPQNLLLRNVVIK